MQRFRIMLGEGETASCEFHQSLRDAFASYKKFKQMRGRPFAVSLARFNHLRRLGRHPVHHRKIIVPVYQTLCRAEAPEGEPPCHRTNPR